MNAETAVSIGLPLLLIFSSLIPKRYKKWVFLKFGMYRYFVLVPLLGIVLSMIWSDARPLFPLMVLLSLFAIFWDFRTLKRMKN
ncbi:MULTISPECIES: hypothetical protein [Pediococcus]|uniref:Integral membrane protein n=1 Tax=Pediococcus ethanolidurans TaxID=319653 RepID=A0A0R2K9T4_9LACO|nr:MULTISPECIES: hypothetical protein [Pediococcus]KRN83255.1 hypothetical protein IV87_GL001287 [Pediococcus ethanolidurans]MCT3032029.1 hypothetical protein [Pediococcus parvulus]MDV7718466.1 hypothetical protein [Pediococcus ethanolidurans]SER30820.1 hypothetical protein SAMN04487973_10486 [Pediococcus ethanolidurans]GEN94609.1 hypothetical protein PET01_06590 [Pediococcus ethanolidurans]